MCAFTVIYLSYSLLWSVCVPVYASGIVPNPNGIPPELLEQLIQQGLIEQTFKYISDQAAQQSGGGGYSGGASTAPFPSVKPEAATASPAMNLYVQNTMELMLMQLATNEPLMHDVVATEDLAIQMTKDFCNEYGDDVFKFLVVDPSNAAKTIFWDYPNQAIESLLEASGAAVVSIGDKYAVFSQSFMDKLTSFAKAHISNGEYYSDLDDLEDSKRNVSKISNHCYVDSYD